MAEKHAGGGTGEVGAGQEEQRAAKLDGRLGVEAAADEAVAEQEEQRHLQRVVAAFRYYRRHSAREAERVRRNWANIPPADLARLPGYGGGAGARKVAERLAATAAAVEVRHRPSRGAPPASAAIASAAR